MKKILSLCVLLCMTLCAFAQVKVQGHFRKDIKDVYSKSIQTKAGANSFTMDDVKFWVGNGSKKALLIVQWNDGKNPEALVWGYKWDGEAHGVDMILAIAKADPRFYVLAYPGTQYGTAIAGMGFDIDGANTIGLVLDGNKTYPQYPVDGVVNTSSYNFDKWTNLDNNDHWQSGWYSNGFWSYWVKDKPNDKLGFSGLGASSRVLVDGSWDAWNFSVKFAPATLAENFIPVEPYKKPITSFTDGIFFVNEDWFGHAPGSVNFMTNNYDFIYNAYSITNKNQTFGTTTQFGTIYGDNFYFVSKQDAGGSPSSGGRLVVADAKTLVKKASFDAIGDGDGRTFIGVNEKLGYIGASTGIYLFNIENLTIGNRIEGTGGGSTYDGQIGNMLLAGDYVFAIQQGVGALVINTKNNTVKETIKDDYNTLVQSVDGSVWLASKSKLTKVNPYTLEKEDISIPEGIEINDSWGAWNAGSFCSSTKENVLYWTNSLMFGGGGSKVIKFDIATKKFNSNFFTLPDQIDKDGKELEHQQTFYGAALRIDPNNGNLVITTTLTGWGSYYQNNWVHIVSNKGELIKTVKLNDYYWFPALAVFPDNFAPTISDDLSNLIINNTTQINLSDKINDDDNLNAAIINKIESIGDENIINAKIEENKLVITPIKNGNTTITIACNSNGKVVKKEIHITSNIKSNVGITANEISCKLYPNPFNDNLTIDTENDGEAIIYSLTGNIVKRFTISNGSNSFNLSDLQRGMYTIKINNHVQKIIKR